MILDTHSVFWLAEAPEMLSAAARQAIRSTRKAGKVLAISDQTLWELAMMLHRNRVQVMSGSAKDFLTAVEEQFTVYAISAVIAERAQLFSERFPRDPRDRIIAATALVAGVPLVTADQRILASGEVPCIW